MTEEYKEIDDLVPLCTCGKCIVKRIRKDNFESFPYNKNLSSAYTSDFDWKNNRQVPKFYNRSKYSGFEGSYKEHLPTGLMSTMKFDFKPFKVKMEDKQVEEHKILSVPFFGRTTYSTNYPSWGAASVGSRDRVELPEIKVPLRGNSNYSENYIKYDKDFYKKRDQLLSKSTLEFYGKFNPDTTFKTSFKPVDFNQPHYFNRERMTKTKVEGKSSLIPAEFPKSNFESLYSQSYVDFKDKRCALSEYMKRKGIKSLEI